MRYGFFGGSFDPPHLGHTLACLWALETEEVDRVLMVPVARHPFGKAFSASFADRAEMCRLATSRLGNAVEVSTIEGRREGVSYTIDTLRALRAEDPKADFRLIAGSDVIGDLPKWREGGEVLRLAPPLELPRPIAGERFADRPGALPPISSTQAREALLAEDPLAESLLSAAVRRYIRTHGLYTPQQGASR